MLTFNGTIGQRVSLKISAVSMTGGNGYVDVYLKRPDNLTLASSSFISSSDFIDVKTIDQNGTHTILVDPQGLNTGSVTLTLYDVPADVSGTIAAGGPTATVTTTVPGQNGQLSFSGTAGQRITLNISNVNLTGGNGYVDVQVKKPDNGSNNWVTVSIKKPDGTTLASNVVDSSGGIIDTQTLPVSGTYTVLADPNNSSSGSVTLQLYDVLPDYTDTIVPGGSAVTVTTTSIGQRREGDV